MLLKVYTLLSNSKSARIYPRNTVIDEYSVNEGEKYICPRR